jgi:hypothetical protein
VLIRHIGLGEIASLKHVFNIKSIKGGEVRLH